MPVTAKLSKELYDTLGEGVTTELVNWFNQVYATSRADLREFNDLNFQRFDARIGERVAELEGRLAVRFTNLEVKFERRLAKLDAKWEQRFAHYHAKLDRRFADYDTKLDRRFAEYDARLDRWSAKYDAKLEAVEARFDRKLEQAFDALRTEMKNTYVTQEQFAQFRSEIFDKLGTHLKWMIALWTGTLLAVVASGFLT